MTNLWYPMALGVVLLSIAVLGGWLSVKALPRRENKAPYTRGVAILGVSGLALTVVVCFQTYKDDAESSRATAKMSADLSDAKSMLDRTQQALNLSLLREQRMEDQNGDLRAIVEATDRKLQVIGRTLPPKASGEVAKIHRDFRRDLSEQLETRDSISPPVTAGTREERGPQRP